MKTFAGLTNRKEILEQFDVLWRAEVCDGWSEWEYVKEAAKKRGFDALAGLNEREYMGILVNLGFWMKYYGIWKTKKGPRRKFMGPVEWRRKFMSAKDY